MTLTLDGNGTISGLGDIDGHDLETNTLVNISDATFAAQAVGRATLFIDASTNTVGINTTTPAAAVFLEVADGTDPIVVLNNTGAGNLTLGCLATGAYIGPESGHSLTLQTDGTARVFIDTNGETFIPSDIFIGYSKASWSSAGATQGDLNFNGSLLGNNGAGNTVLGCGVAGGQIFIGGGNTNTDTVRLQTGTTTKLLVNSIGQVAIGVETPQARSITIRTTDLGSGTNYLNADADILISSSATTGGAIKFESNTAAIITGGIAGEILLQGRQLLFARVDANGIEIPNGGGIYFSSSPGAGASSNLLDDYEEGTWTPSFTINGTTAGINYVNPPSGSYVKIGRFVSCYADFRFTNKGTSSGAAGLNGLPFTVAEILPNTALEGGGLFTYMSQVSLPFGGPITILPSNNSTSCALYFVSNATGSMTGLQGSNLTNTSDFRLTFSYQTD